MIGYRTGHSAYRILFPLCAVAALAVTSTLSAGSLNASNIHVRAVADATRTIKITGFAICGASFTPGTACGTATLSGPGYNGGSVSPSANVGLDYGRFTFDNVSVPNDFSDVTFTVTASASQASAGIPRDESCSKSFAVKGALVIGDTYGVDFGVGPWGWNNVCK